MASTGDDYSLGPIARKMIIGARLRELREESGMTRSEVAYDIRSSESKISRIELGRVGLKGRDLDDMLKMYGMYDADARHELLEFAKGTNQPGWWRKYGEVMPDWLNNLVGLEEATERVQAFELTFVPGLLQTEDYARAVAKQGAPEATADAVEQRVALRMRRQKLLSRPDAPKVWAVLDESVLYRPVGGSDVLRAQLDHLLELAKAPNISIQLLPYERSGYAAESAFSILRFAEPELPNIVYIEHRAGSSYLEDLRYTEPHIRAFDRLMVDAQTPERTKQTLQKRRTDV